MQAIVIETGPEGAHLRQREVAPPQPGPADLIADVRASALNRADLRRAASHFAASERQQGPAVGGLEMAGVVTAIGRAVRGFVPGDRVMAMTGGSWAQQVQLDHRLAIPVPPAMTWAQAAAIPVSFVTAHDALVSSAGLLPGESVLVRGASSAAGLAAIQIARELGAGTVLGTTNSRAKLDLLESLGCQALLTGAGPIADVVRDRTDGRGADIVVDIVGAGSVQDNLDAAAIKGRIVCLGRLAGTEGTFNLDEFSRKRITMKGVTFRTRSFEERVAAVALFREQMLPLLGSGALRPVIDRTFAFGEVDKAQMYMRDNRNFGKVIIEMGDLAGGADH